MKFVYLAGILTAVYLVARVWHRSRRDEDDRAFGGVIGRRYPGTEVAEVPGPTGDGRLSRARSAARAYVKEAH